MASDAALLRAAAAAAALVRIDLRLAEAVLIHLAGAAAAAHADVLQRAAEARGLVALEVGQADEHVRVHDGAADVGLLHELAVRHGHVHLVGAAQAVADEDLAAGGHGVEAVEVGAVHVLKGVFAAARVQGVAVRQERQAALRLAQIGHNARVVRAQKGQIAQLAEVHLDGDELAVHVDVLDAGREAQPLELVRQAGAHRAAKIGKIDRSVFHIPSPCLFSAGAAGAL
jgi:hypothetical protein